MYSVAVKRDFIAQHFLIGGDWGEENFLHSHHYIVELTLEGEKLNQHGYLVDIIDIETALDSLVILYKDKTLNKLIDFEELNPSIEHFCRIICEKISGAIVTKTLSKISVKIWENEIAWAKYSMEVNS